MIKEKTERIQSKAITQGVSVTRELSYSPIIGEDISLLVRYATASPITLSFTGGKSEGVSRDGTAYTYDGDKTFTINHKTGSHNPLNIDATYSYYPPLYGIGEDKSLESVYSKDEVYNKNEVDALSPVKKIATRTGQFGVTVDSGTSYYSASVLFPEATKETAYTDAQISAYIKSHLLCISSIYAMSAASGGNRLSFPICGYRFENEKISNTDYRIRLMVFFSNVTTPISDDWRVFVDFIYV